MGFESAAAAADDEAGSNVRTEPSCTSAACDAVLSSIRMRPRFAARIACDGVPMESGNSVEAMWASRVGAIAGGATAISGSAAAAAAAHCDQPSVSSTIACCNLGAWSCSEITHRQRAPRNRHTRWCLVR